MQNLKNHYVGFCLDNGVLKNSSSGGIFTALARKVFELKGYVFGAVFDPENYEICHIGIQSEDEINPLRKSKYVWSNWKKCIPDIQGAIEKDKYILFTGTPCQANAIRKLVGKYEKLFIVDLFCHGTAEASIFKEYLELFDSPITSIDFRGESSTNISNYNFRMWNNNQIVIDQTYNENIFTSLYLNSAIIRQSCFNCNYANRRHESDLSIGDFAFTETSEKMGINIKHPSIIAVNTDKGKKLLDMISNTIKLFELTNINEIEYYYRSHKSSKGLWGYNAEIKGKFLEDYKKYGFIRAAVYSAYPYEMKLIEKIEDMNDNYEGIALYGNGIIGRRVISVIKILHNEWNVICFLTSKESDKGANDIPTLQIDNALESLKNRIIVITVSEKYKLEIEEELKNRGIINYIS